MDIGTLAVDVGLILTTAFLTAVLGLLGWLGRQAFSTLEGKLDELGAELRDLNTRLRAVELDQARNERRRREDADR